MPMSGSVGPAYLLKRKGVVIPLIQTDLVTANLNCESTKLAGKEPVQATVLEVEFIQN